MAVGVTAFPAAVDTSTELIQATNAVASVVGTGGVDSSATTIPITSTTNAPSSGIAYIGSEVVSYTGKTSTSITGCSRGFDDTTPAAHAAGDPVVFDIISAARFRVLQDAIIATQTRLGAGANPAQSGHVRASNAAWITARNAANTADVNLIRANASNEPEVNSLVVATGGVGGSQ